MIRNRGKHRFLTGWKAIGHTESECVTKKHEAQKAKKIEAGSEDEGGVSVLYIKVGKPGEKEG